MAASAWGVRPVELAVAAIGVSLYAAGLHATGVRAVSRARAASFAGGVAVALGATTGPMHAWAETTFTAHMIQHQVLMLLAAPMVVAGRPALVASLALPSRLRARVWSLARLRPVARVVRVARSPLPILLAYAGVVWTWHLPGPYQAAVLSGTWHGIEHVCFFGAALAFWAGVVRTGPRRRIRAVPAMALVLGTMLLGTWLGAALTFAKAPYPVYAARAAAAGVDPMLDQQIAGAIMWIPSSILLLVVFGGLFRRFLLDLDRRYERRPPAVSEP